MSNPFFIPWLMGWRFQIVLTKGGAIIEAYGFGICLQTSLKNGESPNSAADRLVFNEDMRRKSLHNAWISNRQKQGYIVQNSNAFKKVFTSKSHLSLH